MSSAEDGVTKGLCFECTRCGECCTNRGEYTYVYLSRPEILALAGLLGLSVLEFERRYTFVDRYGWVQLTGVGESCVFVSSETGDCKVYAERPVQCRTFPFWREFSVDGKWTDEVRSLCEGVGRGRACSAEEAESRMREMEASDQD